MQFRQKARRSFAAIAVFVLLIFTMAIPIGAAEVEEDVAVSNVDSSFFYAGGRLHSSDLDILEESIVRLTLSADEADGTLITSAGVGTRFNAVILKLSGFDAQWMQNEIGNSYLIGKDLTITAVKGKGFYIDYVGAIRDMTCGNGHITVATDSTDGKTKEFILNGTIRFETIEIYGFSCAWLATSYDFIIDQLKGQIDFPKAARLAYDEGILRAKIDIAEQIVLSAYGDDNGIVDDNDLEHYFGVDWILSRSVKQLTKHAIGAGYDRGYYAGYDIGHQDGYSFGFDVGYDEGLDDGYDKGYGDGADFGRTDALNSTDTFKKGIFAIFNAPVDLINGVLDFDLLGINVASLVKTVLTLCIVGLIAFVVFKLQKGG